jgi:hypothetical protein
VGWLPFFACTAKPALTQEREDMPVRQLVESDIPQAVSLYWNHMRGRAGAAPPQLRASFRELYFSNPGFDSASPSFVFEDQGGKIVGFLGITFRKMSVSGRPIRAAFGGNFVVHPEARSSLAAARLLDAYIEGDHDLLLTDSANDVTRRILERLRFKTIPAINIHWARPLRPSHYAVHALSKTMAPAGSTSVRLAAKPLCMVVDAVATRFVCPIREPKSKLHGTELDVETLLQCSIEARKGYSLWPESDAHLLEWLLGFMKRSRERGLLRKVAVRNDRQNIVGWYIYYVKRGGVGEVVQVGGGREFFKDVLLHLFRDAEQHGVIALHGLADFRTMADFSDEGCFFTCRGGWTLARSREREPMEALESGNGLLSRLDGEWCLNPGE